MENKVFPTLKDVLLLCFLCIVIQLILGLIISLFQNILILSDKSPIISVCYILTSIISFGIVILIGFIKKKKKFNDVFQFNNVSIMLWISMIIFSVGFVIIKSELDNLLNFILPVPKILISTFGTSRIRQSLIIAIIHTGLIAVFTEELLFRGIILDGFKNNYSKKKAIIVNAVLFGLIHLNPWQFLSAFLTGLITAWIRIETKSIWLCIYIHLFNNILYSITIR